MDNTKKKAPKAKNDKRPKEQGYKDREDESLGMRRGAERGFRQDLQDRRDDSYGKWGSRSKRNNKINK